MRRVDFISTICVGILFLGAPGYAAVQTIDATVTSQVEQTLPTGDVNTDLAHQSLGESTANLPLMAEAGLAEDGFPSSGGGATARLADPRAVQASDPAELGIAVVSNSTNAPSSWKASGFVAETRTIVFSSSEIGSDTGTALTARSFFYVDGILVLWRQAGSSDLTGTTAEVSVRVDQTHAGATESLAVLATGMSFTGQPDGTGTLTTSGSLVPENAAQVDVTDLVPSMGSVQVVILPKLAIPYDYDAAVDESFTLEATIDGRMTSAPGTGAAVILGASVNEVTSLISHVAGQDVGQALGEVLGAVIKENPAPARPLPADDMSTKITIEPQARLLPGWPGGLCGTLGVESVMALALFAGMVGVGATRRLRG